MRMALIVNIKPDAAKHDQPTPKRMYVPLTNSSSPSTRHSKVVNCKLLM